MERTGEVRGLDHTWVLSCSGFIRCVTGADKMGACSQREPGPLTRHAPPNGPGSAAAALAQR